MRFYDMNVLSSVYAVSITTTAILNQFIRPSSTSSDMYLSGRRRQLEIGSFWRYETSSIHYDNGMIHDDHGVNFIIRYGM